MPSRKRNRRPRTRRKGARGNIPSCAEWLMREVLPLFRQEFPAGKRPRRHLRNAAIEVLEAMRAMLDETIEWLRHERRGEAVLKRIRVEG
jgi:hypothetical protein